MLVVDNDHVFIDIIKQGLSYVCRVFLCLLFLVYSLVSGYSSLILSFRRLNSIQNSLNCEIVVQIEFHINTFVSSHNNLIRTQWAKACSLYCGNFQIILGQIKYFSATKHIPNSNIHFLLEAYYDKSTVLRPLDGCHLCLALALVLGFELYVFTTVAWLGGWNDVFLH